MLEVCVCASARVCVCVCGSVRACVVCMGKWVLCLGELKPNWYFLILKLYYHICVYIALLRIEHGLGVNYNMYLVCMCESGFSVWHFEELCVG